MKSFLSHYILKLNFEVPAVTIEKQTWGAWGTDAFEVKKTELLNYGSIDLWDFRENEEKGNKSGTEAPKEVEGCESYSVICFEGEKEVWLFWVFS